MNMTQKTCLEFTVHLRVSFAQLTHVHCITIMFWKKKLEECDENPNYTYFEKINVVKYYL